MQLNSVLVHKGMPHPQLTSLKAKLVDLGVAFTENVMGDYDQAIKNYTSIQKADLMIVICPDGVVTGGMIRWVLYAMLKNKPIILLEAPRDVTGMDYFDRQVVGKRFNKVLVCNLLMLDDDDAATYLRNSAKEKTNYVLTNNERVLIKARIKAHFRNLLKQN